MNLKKLLVFSIAGFMAGLFFVVSSHAQEKPVVKVQTNEVSSLTVGFESARRGIVSGNVTGAVLRDDLAEIIYKIEAYPDRDEVWKKKIQWNEALREGESVTIPFQFDLSEIAITEKFIFSVDIIDRRGELIASGASGGQIPPQFTEVRTASIQDLEITTQGTVQASFVFVNGNESQTVKPELMLREHSVDGDRLFALTGEEVELGVGTKHTFSFSFDRPAEPELYIVEVRVVSDKNKPVTGYLRDEFLIEGDFAEINSIHITPDRAMEAGETADFAVSGVVDNERGALEMNFKAFLLPEKEGEKPLQETRAFTAEGNQFTETFSFLMPRPTKELNVFVQISRDGNVIEEKAITYQTQKIPASFLVDIPQKVIKNYGEGGFELWMAVVLAVAIIIFLIAKLHRKKQFHIFLLLLTSCLSFSVAHGAWKMDWYSPTSGTIFNPTSNEGFETIVFQGRIYDDSLPPKGYFQGDLTSVKVELIGGQTLTKYIPVEDVTIGAERSYIFDLNLTDTEFASITEGDWNAQITFEDSGQSSAVQTTWDGTIGIDMTPPEITFSYTPDTFTSESVAVSISCTDNKAGCLDQNVYPYWEQYAPFDLSVLGNFSNAFENGTRGYSICDTVGNCTSTDTEKISIDLYDPVAPNLSGGITIEREGLPLLKGEGGFANNILSADDTLRLSLVGVEDSTEGEAIEQDDHACGREATDDTFLAENIQVSFDVVSSEHFSGAWVGRQRNGGGLRTFKFFNAEGLGAYTYSGTVVEGSEYKFELMIKTGEGEDDFESTRKKDDPGLSIGETWNGTLGKDTPYETQISNFTATIEPNSQRCMAKYFVCPINYPSGGGSPYRKEMTEFIDSQTCADLQEHDWTDVPTCGFPLTFPFTLEDC